MPTYNPRNPTPERSFREVTWGGGSKQLETELQEMQQIMRHSVESAVSAIVTDGVTTYSGYEVSFGADDCTLTINAPLHVVVDGDVITITEDIEYTIPAPEDDATVYLWLASRLENKTYQSTLHTNGNLISGSTITNDLMDERFGFETSRRVQRVVSLSTTLTASSGSLDASYSYIALGSLDFANEMFIESGIQHSEATQAVQDTEFRGGNSIEFDVQVTTYGSLKKITPTDPEMLLPIIGLSYTDRLGKGLLHTMRLKNSRTGASVPVNVVAPWGSDPFLTTNTTFTGTAYDKLCLNTTDYPIPAEGAKGALAAPGTLATKQGAHSAGVGTVAAGIGASAEGIGSVAYGDATHVDGWQSIASAYALVTVTGHDASGYVLLSGASRSAIIAGTRLGMSTAYGSVTFTVQSVDGTDPSKFYYDTALYPDIDGWLDAGNAALTKSVLYILAGEKTGDFNKTQGARAGGYQSVAGGKGSFAYGTNTRASNGGTAFGSDNLASEAGAMAGGADSLAKGFSSGAFGVGVTATHEGATVLGKNGDSPESYSWALANGSSRTVRGLAAKILQSGQVFADDYVSSGADYAEAFEWLDGNPEDEDRVGYFVTTSGRFIRKATSQDTYIQGVVSARPSILGDAAGLHWQGKYLVDEWGRVRHELITVPAVMDGDRVIAPERHAWEPLINPEWNPNEPYVDRIVRPEYAAVGVVGKLRVRDDGTCQVDGYCMPNDDGVATSSSEGYRVLERSGENQVIIFIK